MRSTFNDLSIRSKLILIVSGAVVALTLAVLGVVWWNARDEVNRDVASELQESRRSFLLLEQERLRNQVEQAAALAADEQVRRLLVARDARAACSFLDGFLADDLQAGKDDSYDVAALLNPDGSPLAVARRGQPCADPSARRRWLPVRLTAGATDWENSQGEVFQAAVAPVRGRGVLLGAFAAGRQVSDALAAHVKLHTGKDVVYWHVETGASLPHLIATSIPQLDRALEAGLVFSSGSGEFRLQAGGREYTIMDASAAATGDPQANPEGLRLALIESESEKLQPFRHLELVLAGLAGCTLLFALLTGVVLSQPIALPLITLAGAADSVAHGKLDVVPQILGRHPRRLQARDEVGVLGRSFLRMVEELQERLAMAPFLSDATHEMIRRHPGAPAGTTRESIAIFFSDIRQFSKFSESRDPQAVIDTVNRVLGIQAEIVRAHGGDIDKYVGDALVAWFAGPARCANAVAAAREAVAALRRELGGQPGTGVGFGIHVGEVVLGVVGSEHRRDYTAIGSNVNLAARLCSAAAEYQILVSEQVARELRDSVPLRPLPPVAFKGFSGLIPVYEVQQEVAAAPSSGSTSADGSNQQSAIST